MPLDPVRNFAKVQVSTGYDASATSIDLVAGDGAKLPDPATEGAFNLTWWNWTDYKDPADDPNKEVVRCTGKNVDTLSPIIRAQEGTTATAKNLPGKTYKMVLAMTKKMRDDIGSGLSITAKQLTPPPTSGHQLRVAGEGFNSDTTVAYFYRINVPCTITVNHIRFLLHSVTTGGTFDIALYSADGQTKLWEETSGTVSGVEYGFNTSTPRTITPGEYYLGFIQNSGDFVFLSYDSSNTPYQPPTGKPRTVGKLTGQTSGTLPATFDPTALIIGAMTTPVVGFWN